MTDDNGTDTRRSHLTAREVGYIDGKRDALASAVARGAAHARLVEAARAYVEAVTSQSKADGPSDFIAKSARRAKAFEALAEALAEVDRER